MKFLFLTEKRHSITSDESLLELLKSQEQSILINNEDKLEQATTVRNRKTSRSAAKTELTISNCNGNKLAKSSPSKPNAASRKQALKLKQSNEKVIFNELLVSQNNSTESVKETSASLPIKENLLGHFLNNGIDKTKSNLKLLKLKKKVLKI